jgi:hypothetical protein
VISSATLVSTAAENDPETTHANKSKANKPSDPIFNLFIDAMMISPVIEWSKTEADALVDFLSQNTGAFGYYM